MTPRFLHSITATSLGPGLTEVLVFGGLRKVGGDAIAETTILRFGEQLLIHVRSHGNYCLIDKYRIYLNKRPSRLIAHIRGVALWVELK